MTCLIYHYLLHPRHTLIAESLLLHELAHGGLEGLHHRDREEAWRFSLNFVLFRRKDLLANSRLCWNTPHLPDVTSRIIIAFFPIKFETSIHRGINTTLTTLATLASSNWTGTCSGTYKTSRTRGQVYLSPATVLPINHFRMFSDKKLNPPCEYLHHPLLKNPLQFEVDGRSFQLVAHHGLPCPTTPEHSNDPAGGKQPPSNGPQLVLSSCGFLMENPVGT